MDLKRPGLPLAASWGAKLPRTAAYYPPENAYSQGAMTNDIIVVMYITLPLYSEYMVIRFTDLVIAMK